MSDQWRAVVLSGLLATATGCFSEPVAPPDGRPVDSKLVGEWDCKSVEKDSSDQARLTVLPFDESQYYAEWKEDEKVDRYRAYSAKLKGVAILNVREIGDAPTRTPWTAMRASVDGAGSLSLDWPGQRILDMSEEADALRELRAKADTPGAWQPFARCSPRRK